LDRGTDFETLARKFSQDSLSAPTGGDLGFFRKGTFDPRFEKAAFALDAGQYTPVPVQTNQGIHLIKLLERRDAEARVAHILFAVKPDGVDTLNTRMQADSVRLRLVAAPDSFASLAIALSQDENTRNNGGKLGWFPRAELDPTYAQVVRDLGSRELSQPVLIDGACHLFRLDDQQEVRPLNLQDDWNQIEMVARNLRMQKRLQEFSEKWRRDVHIEIRDPELR